MDIGNAIKQARVAQRMTQEQLGRHFGISKSAVNQWESGRNVPDARKLAELVRLLGLDPAVATGLVEAEAPVAPFAAPGDGAPLASVPPPLPYRDDMRRDVPILGTSLGGDENGDFADFEMNGQIVDYARRPPRLIGRTDVFAIFVQGLSMSPWREPGDLAYIDRNRPPRTGDYVVVEFSANAHQVRKALIKKLVALTPTKIRLAQYNPPRTIEIDRQRGHQLYRVIDWSELMGL